MNLNLRINLFIKNCDGTTQRLRPRRKTQISHSNVLNNMKSGHLKVSYGKDLCNEGVFDRKEDLLYALKAWTEKELLEYAKNGGW